MTELKTKENDASVTEFINSIEHKTRKADALVLLDLMGEVIDAEPTMWGKNIIGYGNYHYKYKSGREGDWFVTGFSPRKQNLSIYIMPGFDEYGDLLEQLGKHKISVGCLYINKLADVDLDVLKQLVARSIVDIKAIYG